MNTSKFTARLPQCWMRLDAGEKDLLVRVAQTGALVIDNERHGYRKVWVLFNKAVIEQPDATPTTLSLRITAYGRVVLAQVARETLREAGDQLWAWLRSGPGLNTRADF